MALIEAVPELVAFHILPHVLEQGLLVRGSWTREELDLLVQGAEHSLVDHVMQVLLCDNAGLELGEVEPVAEGSLIELALALDDLLDLMDAMLLGGDAGHAWLCLFFPIYFFICIS